MKTPTHALISYGCARLLGWRGRMRSALVIGAIAPDLPVAVVWSWIAAAVTLRDGRFHQPAIQVEMDKVYFSESWLSALHSLLHSPVSLAGLALLLCLLDRRGTTIRPLGLAFLIGAMTHALADIASHVTDGPLLLWPLDGAMRLRGPFSHWDPAFGGLWVSGLEALAAAVFALVWLVRRTRRGIGRWLSGAQGSEAAGTAALTRRLTVIR